MTGKELHKLKRQDLLKLLLAQAREAESMRQKYEQSQAEVADLNTAAARLRTRLDEKDALINKLKGRLDKKDQQLRDLRDLIDRRRTSRDIRLTEAGSIAQAALQLNGVFEAAQKAADQYIYNLQQMQERMENGGPMLAPEEPIPASVMEDEGDDELRAMLHADALRNARGAMLIPNPDEMPAQQGKTVQLKKPEQPEVSEDTPAAPETPAEE